MIRLEGHSVVLYGKSFYFFGGYDLSKRCATNDVYRVDLADLERGSSGAPAAAVPSVASDLGRFNARTAQAYSEVPMYALQTTGPVPSPRAFHASCLRGPHLVVWGGTMDASADDEHATQPSMFSSSPTRSDPSSKSSRPFPTMDLYGLNLETLVWTEYRVASVAPNIKRQTVPQPRCHATMISTEESMLLYGGYPSVVHGGEAEAAIAENEWNVFSVAADGQCDAQEPAGAAPALWGHSMVHAHRCLVVFGGVDVGSSEEVRSLCIYHIDEQRWRWAEFPEGPCPRAMHAAAIDYASGEMLVFGGFTSSVEDAAAVSSSLEDAPDSGSLAVQLSDVWSFSLETGLWERLWPAAEKPPPQEASGHTTTVAAVSPKGRSGHVVVCHDRRLYSFGGLIDDQSAQRDDRIVQHGTKPASWLTNSSTPAPRTSTSNSTNEVGGSGTVAIFDVLSRTWTMKQLFLSKQSPSSAIIVPGGATPSRSKPSAGTWSSAPPADSDAARFKRESIIDRYLNPAPPQSDGSPVLRKGPDYRVADSSASRVRTVSTRHSPDSGFRGSDGRGVEGFSSFFGSTPPRSSVLLGGSPTDTRTEVVATTMRLVREEEQQRRAQASPSLSPFRPSHHESDHKLSPSSSRLFHVDSLSDSPLLPQHQGIAEYRRQLSERQEAANSVGSVVSAIAQAQNEADLRWTQAEQERRARLLVRYTQVQPAGPEELVYHGGRTPQRSSLQLTALQDDESPTFAAQSSSPSLDKRFLVQPSQVSSATPHAGSLAAARRSVSNDRLTVSHPTSVDRFVVLDVDESPPAEEMDATAAPHHPLWPGPWGRSTR